VTPEIKYLNNLVQCYLTGEKVQPLSADVDLDKLLDLMRSHQVLTTLGSTLVNAGLPEDYGKRITQTLHAAAQVNTVILLELTRFLEPLDNAGCSPIVLKGAGLVQSIYPSLEQRVFSDLDILVPLDKMEKTKAVLENLGFVPSETIASFEYYTKHHFHLIFLSPGGITVEIHWNLTPPHSTYQFDLKRLSGRTQMIDTPNGTLRIPNWTDQLLHCVFQNLADGFSGLRRIIDAALILPLIKDQEALVKEAREQNLATGLWAVLHLVREFSPSLVSDDLMARLQPAPFVCSCFEVFDLKGKCFERAATKKMLLNNYTNWLCSPSKEVAGQKIWHYLIPRSQDYFYFNHDHGAPPVWFQRIKISIKHLFDLLGLSISLAYQLVKK